MESEEFFLDGYRTIHRPAETGVGKQGVALAVRAQLQSRELGAVSPFFCMAEVRDLIGKLTLGSVYIPHRRKPRTMGELGRAVARVAETKDGILFGGDWNMSRKKTLAEAKKWNVEVRVAEHSGGMQSRHGGSKDRRKWSAIDFFLVVGKLECGGGKT
ncbi:MAG: uncharacterized protein A8A55_2935, partial [Amphiamblys sp. WSBS2006]